MTRSRTRRGTGPLLACWTAAAVLAAGCGPSGTDGVPAPGGTPGAGAAAPARVDVPELLRDSWVTDGRRGWFVEGAGSASRPPFSLYETAWRLRTAALPGRHGEGVHVRPVRLRRWIRTAEAGRLDSSGLPPVAQTDLAVQALRAAGGSVDRARVARALESLRDGGDYRTGPGAHTAGPGGTATAVRVLTLLDLTVPEPVVTAHRRALRELTAGEAAADPGRAVPLLETAAALGVPDTGRDHVAALARAALRALTPLDADPVRLAAEGTLRDAARRLGVRLPRFDPRTCDGQVLPDGGIGLPGAGHGDPQATYWALRLGCTAVRAPAAGAHSRAGWPTQGARESALSTSAAAVAVAVAAGRTAEFAVPLTRQVHEVWLPRLDDPAPYGTAELADRVNLRQIAGALGADLARDVQRRLPAPSPRGIRPDDDARLLLAALDARGSAPGRAALCPVLRTAAARGDGGGSLVRAAWLTAAADLCDLPRLRDRARELAGRARLDEAVYRAGDGPSFEASVLGTWVERPRADAVTAWTEAGLCAAGRCAETPDALAAADHTPLRTLAVLLAARKGAYEALFPVSF
ncbi:hypothetical protein OG411_24100 [Streptomyces pseudogriseolus]|uniref:Secreted protein n=2 Tax=Streptomyces TaxID=1883 RepID=A0AB39NJ58_9ACTN